MNINGQTYEVITRDTIETIRGRGLKNLAAEMEANNCIAQTYVKKPRGRNIYSVHEFADGRLSYLTKVA